MPLFKEELKKEEIYTLNVIFVTIWHIIKLLSQTK